MALRNSIPSWSDRDEDWKIANSLFKRTSVFVAAAVLAPQILNLWRAGEKSSPLHNRILLLTEYLKTKAVRQNVISANKNKDTMFSIKIMCFDKICPRQSERQQPLCSISHRVWLRESFLFDLLPSLQHRLYCFSRKKNDYYPP